eukprot:SAG22_NODE_3235_length_1841_cov_1.193456_2_plen_197_part_01
MFGDISGFSVLHSLTHLNLAHTYVHGDIGGFGTIAGLVELRLDRASGTIETSIGDRAPVWTALPSNARASAPRDMTTFSALTGDIGGFSELVNLTYLSLVKNEAITGDIGPWSALRNLEVLRLENNYALHGDLTDWHQMASLRVLHIRSCTIPMVSDHGFEFTGCAVGRGELGIETDNLTSADVTDRAMECAHACAG